MPASLAESLFDLVLGANRVVTVTLTLPHAERATDVPPMTGEVDDDVAVLLVEDNLINQLVAIEQLRGLAVRDVTLASDGVAALERAGERSYDVILMDLQMPRLDGYDATRRLRATAGHNQHTPVVAMTAHALDDDRKRCRDAGMEGYLIKPVERDALRPWLRKRGTR